MIDVKMVLENLLFMNLCYLKFSKEKNSYKLPHSIYKQFVKCSSKQRSNIGNEDKGCKLQAKGMHYDTASVQLSHCKKFRGSSNKNYLELHLTKKKNKQSGSRKKTHDKFTKKCSLNSVFFRKIAHNLIEKLASMMNRIRKKRNTCEKTKHSDTHQSIGRK